MYIHNTVHVFKWSEESIPCKIKTFLFELCTYKTVSDLSYGNDHHSSKTKKVDHLNWIINTQQGHPDHIIIILIT